MSSLAGSVVGYRNYAWPFRLSGPQLQRPDREFPFSTGAAVNHTHADKSARESGIPAARTRHRLRMLGQRWTARFAFLVSRERCVGGGFA